MQYVNGLFFARDYSRSYSLCMTIGDRLDKAMKDAKIPSQSALQRASGVPQATISRILKGAGKKGPETETIKKLAAACNVSFDWLNEGVGRRERTVRATDFIEVPFQISEPQALPYGARSEVDDGPDFAGATKQLPVVGQVQAGPDGLLHIDDYPVGHGTGTVPYWTRCPDAYALRIRGESMSPRYLPGEFVAVDPCTDVLPNNEVIAILKDGRRMIKRLLWQNDEQICFESINKNYQNIICERVEIERLHKVLGGIPAEAFKKNF